MRVNALEVERAVLFEQATGLKLAAPEIAHVETRPSFEAQHHFSFDDPGDELANKLGLN